MLGHEDADVFHLLFAQGRHRLVQDLGQGLGQFEHLVVTIGFGLIHEQALRIAAAAVHHFDGHSSPLTFGQLVGKYWMRIQYPE
ncbi:hypothetical protein D3C71_1878410 [compost metagenome]